ncbi:tetratricopeptide repeat protein [bacterium]|nr:tetratricopeptide repeat protein [bacterium]
MILAPRSLTAILAVFLASCLSLRASADDGTSPGGAASEADRARADADTARSIQALLGDDWKVSREAEKALEHRGALGARIVLRSRATDPSARHRERLDRVLRSVVSALVIEIQRPLLEGGDPFSTASALAGDGAACIDVSDDAAIGSEALTEAQIDEAGIVGQDEPRSGRESKLRARAAREALLLLGPPAVGIALEVPPVRKFETERALFSVLRAVYERESARARAAAGDAAAVNAFREAWRGAADLAAPFLALGIDPENERRDSVRALFQLVRDDALDESLKDLGSEDPDRRESSQDALARLGHLARPALERIARGDDKAHASPEAKLSAERLANRIRYRLSPALVRKLGHEMEGYAALPLDKRRSRAFELERLGGADAVPALRALLTEEPSDEVRAACAIGLYKQGDWVGAEWLQVHGQRVSLISSREKAALILDQGNKYLTARKYAQAEAQYKQVLAIEPQNSVALYNLACTYSLSGRTDEAIDYLKQAIAAGFDDDTHMEQDQDLDPIRDDPRYKQVREALKAKKAKARGEGEPR